MKVQSAIYTSSHLGGLLQGRIRVTGEERYSRCIDSYLDVMRSDLGDEGVLSTITRIAGRYEDGNIAIYVDEPYVQTHEEAHRDMDGAGILTPPSFDEGCAFAIEYALHGHERLDEILENSAGMCRVHAHLMAQAENGGMTDYDLGLMKQVVARSSMGYSPENWPAILLCFEDHRYLSLFHAVLEEFGMDMGKRVIFKAARIAQTSQMEGIHYLECRIESPYYSKGTLNDLPIWEGLDPNSDNGSVDVVVGPNITVKGDSSDERVIKVAKKHLHVLESASWS